MLTSNESIRGLTVALALALAGTACGSSSSSSSNPSNPTAPGGTSGACRTYPTTANVTTTALGVTQTAMLTGSFNASTNQATITISFTGGALCSTAVHTWRSTADFVDETRVIPPRPLVLTTVTTNSGACGSGTGTSTNTYDSQRRLATQTSSAGGTTTYTAWDSSNRPTAGTMSNGGTIANVYNDAARTVTQTQVSGGTTSVSTQTFDANGAQTQIVVTTSGVTSTTTFTNTATATVCS